MFTPVDNEAFITEVSFVKLILLFHFSNVTQNFDQSLTYIKAIYNALCCQFMLRTIVLFVPL